ncbi:MAG: glycoside hydrolase family 25 protein [Nitrososphaerota archaeon]|nr:glycoside hydrolase family 25 protein [Nitrososphaerota archaeon]
MSRTPGWARLALAAVLVSMFCGAGLVAAFAGTARADIYGPDISAWQGQPDWGALSGQAQFVMIRASYSGGVDGSLGYNRDWARTTGTPHGFYHYAYPQYSDPVADANFFADVVGQLQPGEVVALDAEESYGDWPNWALAWLRQVQARTGVKPLIYMNYSFAWGFDWSAVVAGDYGIWEANWDYDASAAPPSTPWGVVAMRQFANNFGLAGIGGPVDMNVFYGDAATFLKYGAPSTPPPTAVSPPAVPPSSTLPAGQPEVASFYGFDKSGAFYKLAPDISVTAGMDIPVFFAGYAGAVEVDLSLPGHVSVGVTATGAQMSDPYQVGTSKWRVPWYDSATPGIRTWLHLSYPSAQDAHVPW